MEYIILLIIGYVAVSYIARLLRHFMKSETVAVWIAAFVCFCIPGWDWVGLLIALSGDQAIGRTEYDCAVTGGGEVFAGGVNMKGDICGHAALQQAYEMGKNV